MDHYFTARAAKADDLGVVPLTWRGRELPWHVARGTFATRGLDQGTALLLDSLRVEPGQALLDVGCGTGALGLLPHLEVPGLTSVLVDVNPTAALCAALNARALGIRQALVVVGRDTECVRAGRFDVAVTNPPIRAGNDTVERIFHGSIDSLRAGGSFYMVVRVRQGGWTLARRLGDHLQVTPELIERHKGYLVFRLCKPVQGRPTEDES